MSSKDNSIGKYDDIINMPRHVSPKRSPMSMHDRAAQFAPFAALTGHGAAINETARLTSEMIELSEEERSILDMKQRMLIKMNHLRPEVTVTWFCHDEMKSGGKYMTLTGTIKDIDDLERVVIMDGGERIPIDCIAAMESRVFEGVF